MRYAITLVLLLFDIIVHAQDYIVKVEQRFSTSNHCAGGHPSIKRMMVSFNGLEFEKSDENSFESGSISECNDNTNPHETYWDYTTAVEQHPKNVTVYNEIVGFGRKGRTWIQDHVYSNLSVGENRLNDLRDKTNCSTRHTESYELATKIIIDCPVMLQYYSKDAESESSHLVIEKDEKLLLKVGEFYNDVDPKLQVSFNEIGKDDLKGRHYEDDKGKLWLNLDIKISPKGNVSLSYEDIVGKLSDTNSLYLKVSGRTMSFRIKKKMIDGSYKSGNVVENVRFYHQGPEFSVNKIRRVKCTGGPELAIRVKLATPKDIGIYLNNPKVFHWVLKHYPKWENKDKRGNGVSIFDLGNSNISSNGEMVLVGRGIYGSKKSLSDYLNENADADPSEGLWQLQLQYDGEHLKDTGTDGLYFVTHTFKIEPPIEQMTIAHEVGTYTTDDDFAIVSKSSPEINLKFDDNDWRSRMDYNIYQFGNGSSSIWTGISSDKDKASVFEKMKQNSAPRCTISKYSNSGAYSVPNLFVNKESSERYFYVQDNDKCIYEVKYKALQKDFSTTPKSKDIFDINRVSGDAPTDARYSTTIKYDGGAFPYFYNGKWWQPQEAMAIENLKFRIENGEISGKNTLTLKGKDGREETVEIVIPFVKPSFNVAAQTCSEPNGKIFLKSPGTFTPVKYKISDKESGIGSFENLEYGNHQVTCYYSDGCSTMVNVKVPQNIFTIDTIPNISLQDFDKTATVTIKPNNYSHLTWENGGIYNISGSEQHSLSSGTYKYKVTNHSNITNDRCVIEGGFTITAPHAEVGLRVEAQEDGDGYNIKTSVTQNEVSNSDEIKNTIKYYTVLNGEIKASEVLRTYSETEGSLHFVAKYKIGDKEQSYQIGQPDGGISPILLKGDKESYFKVDGMPQPKCHKETVTWTLTDGYEACAKGSEAWGKSISLKQGTNEVTIRKKETKRLGNSVDFIATVENIGYKDLTIDIAEIPNISIAITETPVTCFGDKNGSVEITSVEPQNKWNKYTYEITMGDRLSYTAQLAGLPSGKGRIKVTDNYCKYSSSDDFTIKGPETGLTINAKTIQPSCHDKGGVFEINANGGWGNYSVSLDGELGYNAVEPNETKSFYQLAEGKHTIQVVDGNGCKQTVNTTINLYKNPYVTDASSVSTSCFGLTDGEINNIEVKTNERLNGESVHAEKIIYSFTPKDGEIYKATENNTRVWDGKIGDLAAGSYKLWVEDNNGCKTDDGNEYQVTIAEPDPLKVEAQLLDKGQITDKGGNDGRMEIKVTAGNASNRNIIKYGDMSTIVPTQVSYTVGGLSAGTIEISATDSMNCPSDTVRVTFVEPEKALTIEAETTPALCHAMTGTVKVKADGGWGDYAIRLSCEREKRNVSNNAEVTFAELYAGNYNVTVTDRRGAQIEKDVTVSAPAPVKYELTTTPDHCGGNGTAAIHISGGTHAYASLFNLDTDSIYGNSISLTNLVGGREYKLTTRDANTCESNLTFKMPDNRLSAEISYMYNQNNEAELSAKVTGGVMPYTYKWRDVSRGVELGSSEKTAVTHSGLYRLDIKDGSGCTSVTMKYVQMIGSLAMKVKSVRRTTNIANNDGAATIICKATQSAKVRLYHLETDTWTTSIKMQNDTTITLSGLTPGNYCVEGEIEKGNKQMTQFYIAPYEPMEVTKMDVRHVSSPGRNDARVVIDFKGGIAPFTVNDTATYETSYIELTNIAAGRLALSVADSTGNVLFKEVEIGEPEPLVVEPSQVGDASCFGYSDGSVALMATGGWPGYQFAKCDGEYKNSAYFGELNAGERTFLVVDKYGVEDSVTVTVGEPEPLRASVAAIDSASCKGMNDGAAHFVLTGGTAPYRTMYEKETADGTDVGHLPAGSYVMKFTDSHGCKSPDTVGIYIPEPDLLELDTAYVTHTTCELDNGKIAIEMKGGSLPYSYEWTENGAKFSGAKTVNLVRSEATALKQNGLYHINITDLHGCQSQYEKRIDHSENPRLTGVATTDVLCYGASDGIAAVDSSQVRWGYPKANYSLTWPQGQTGVMSVNTLPAGIYLVKITDDNNCSTAREFTVGTPEPVKNNLTGVRDALCFGYSDGRIETHTTGGVGDYAYVWDTGETTSYADNLKAGMYKVIVTDSHECKDTATYEVKEPEKLKVDLGDDVIICPGNVHVFDAGEYASYSWLSMTTGEEIETERYLATGEEGDYAIKVTNEIGCIACDTVNMAIGENALEANFLIASDAAVNDTIMLVELSNMPVDSVRWQYDKLKVVEVEDAETYMIPLMAESTGRYYITMWAYSGGCEASEQKFIDIYEAVVDTNDFKIGYDPLIKQAKVSPNPNDGVFNLIVAQREVADIEVTVHDVDNGRQVGHVVLKGSDKYNTRLDIRQWGSGIFVLSVASGTERRAIKVLCVK